MWALLSSKGEPGPPGPGLYTPPEYKVIGLWRHDTNWIIPSLHVVGFRYVEGLMSTLENKIHIFAQPVISSVYVLPHCCHFFRALLTANKKANTKQNTTTPSDFGQERRRWTQRIWSTTQLFFLFLGHVSHVTLDYPAIFTVRLKITWFWDRNIPYLCRFLGCQFHQSIFCTGQVTSEWYENMDSFVIIELLRMLHTFNTSQEDCIRVTQIELLLDRQYWKHSLLLSRCSMRNHRHTSRAWWPPSFGFTMARVLTAPSFPWRLTINHKYYKFLESDWSIIPPINH